MLSAHVDVVEPLSSAKDATLIPPSDAVPVNASGSLDIKLADLKGHLIKKAFPEYPASAKHSRIEGTVVIQVEIDEEGNIAEMTILSAPDPSLAISALQTVHQWQYSPYLLNGIPVRVHTEITVVYQLGN
jgi:protein TonB